jgi:hypothetical protein
MDGSEAAGYIDIDMTCVALYYNHCHCTNIDHIYNHDGRCDFAVVSMCSCLSVTRTAILVKEKAPVRSPSHCTTLGIRRNSKR